MLLSDYLSVDKSFEGIGVFDPVLDKDSHFFINLQRLKKQRLQNLEILTRRSMSISVRLSNCLIKRQRKMRAIYVIGRH